MDELVKEVCVKLDPFPKKSFIPPKISGMPPPRILPNGERLLNGPKLPPSKPKGDNAPEKRKHLVYER